MQTLALHLALLTAATAGVAHERFTDHKAFYQYVEQTQGWSRPFFPRTVEAGTPADSSVRVRGLSPAWGTVKIGRNSILIAGRRLPWMRASWPMSRPMSFRMDIELVRAWEQPNEPRLCLQSPAGDSGGSARTQHVVVVHRPRTPATRMRLFAWTNPYASCESLFFDKEGRLLVGLFQLQMESARAISSASFSVRDLMTGHETKHFALTLADADNAFDFWVTPSTVPSAR
ncbi:hypothetical protein [Ideonella sp. BN130291]|uniref:hypothetical protein n=1 Tax=Ideonella sp. BN130291 TaxID=3112940 RepID=UPI002E255DF1|nr:hypothetical protein [Ideonella sp. BN130291]